MSGGVLVCTPPFLLDHTSLPVFRTSTFRDFVYAAALAEDLKKASMSALIVSGLVVHIP